MPKTKSTSQSASISPSRSSAPTGKTAKQTTSSGKKPVETSSVADNQAVSGDKVAVSVESQREQQTDSNVNGLVAGLSDWAGPEESGDSGLDLGEGELLGVGRDSNPEKVTELQEMLRESGLELAVDGKFGPETRGAVEEFQRRNNLQVDGIVGPETQGALNSGGQDSEVAEPDVPAEPNPDVRNTTTLNGIPPRAEDAVGGREFMESISHLPPGPERNRAILDEFMSGNIPDASRNLNELVVNRNGREIRMHAMSDYLSIGSNQDNVRIPMTPEVAQAIADRTGTSLPTDRIVDDIHAQSRQLHMSPFAWREGRQHAINMESIDWFAQHDGRIDAQLGTGDAQTSFVSGHKKDIVIPARDGQVAIYGGRWQDGSRIQGYSNVHGDYYADYSHGARLVSQEITVDGQSMRLEDALADPNLRSLFTNHGHGYDIRY